MQLMGAGAGDYRRPRASGKKTQARSRTGRRAQHRGTIGGSGAGRLGPERKGETMCRWMAWHGQPVLIEELLFKPKHGLIDQSLHARMGSETTNGDGFGMGWYGTGEGPGGYRSISPAWGDPNLRHLAGHIESPLFLAHVRAASGTTVQETHCHPYRHRRWLFVDNDLVNEFPAVRRELMLALDPALFTEIQGSTDSEVLFHLARTNGLEEEPLAALERTVGFVEETASRHGIDRAIQASIGGGDGERRWPLR